MSRKDKAQDAEFEETEKPKATHSVIWIPVTGKINRELERSEPELSDLLKYVGGDIESVRISSNQIAIVNDEGRREGLPLNERASEIAGQPLLGNVVIIRIIA